MRTREAMTRYLLRQTRYTLDELNQLDDETLYRWYKEEIETDKE
ncbi:MAG: hypothetical protein ABFD25_00890 [Clostridiaceae bacterium]